MKLCINGRFLTQNITGVQRYAHEVLKALDQFENLPPTRIIVPRNSEIPEIKLSQIKICKQGVFSGHLWEQFSLPTLVQNNEVLLCLGNTAPIPLLILRKAPVVVVVHSLSYKYFPKSYSKSFRILYNLILPQVFKRAAKVITVSESERVQILRLYPDCHDRLVAIQSGISDLGAPLEVSSVASLAHPYLLFVGSLSRGKNIEGVLQAFEKIVLEDDISLVIAGASGNSFQQLNVPLSEAAKKRVLFLGQVNNPRELAYLYKKAICLVFPSYYEASPLPPTEAMAMGCPVIASNIEALKERCGNAAIYVEASDSDQIKAAALSLIKSSEKRQNLSNLGREWIARYSWRSHIEQILKLVVDAYSRAKG